MNGLRMVADLMAIAARTAPKSAGRDYVVLEVLEGEVLDALADDMVAYGREQEKRNFDRDAENVRASAAVLLLGLHGVKPLGLNCGACGALRCPPMHTVDGEFAGPSCALHLLDLGIALGSAVKVASMLNVDNRIMYRIGVSARRMGLLAAEVIMGIPLSASGKNIYFDR